MPIHPIRRLLPAPLLASLLSVQLPIYASAYDALCGDAPCTINLDASGISGPAGFIPTPRIAQWFTGGDESFNVGKGTAGALGAATLGAIGGGLLLGPIGLLGGLIGGGIAGSKAGRTADLFFNVVGYDQTGQKTTLSFRFTNSRPANRLKTELPMFTGLAMGQTRSLEDLKMAVASGSAPAALPERLQALPGGGRAAASAALPDNLLAQPAPQQPVATTPTAGAPGSTWEAYLKERNLEAWARNNPVLAEQLRQRLFQTL
ncbi:hypothetical protein KBY65_13305 [Cyanobium sp. Alchichica 3B3-8F6]|uniref:hypothetical protein n=1 Tax=Cyanobium sp. Alchichica 3B3-8F6 TaxID=2823696 RepID=UPI0020CF9364|nr:hypothetical protein [Cyanobium sp. Alchichica 3B3-8F6]MCP9883432.1 hypothetical protein [Cyanobium sp. Alchichica 3B3-8F6]